MTTHIILIVLILLFIMLVYFNKVYIGKSILNILSITWKFIKVLLKFFKKILFLPSSIISGLFCRFNKLKYTRLHNEVDFRKPEKCVCKSYNDISNKHTWIISDYLYKSLRNRKNVIYRLSFSTLILDVIFGISFVHGNEFIYKQKENILNFSDETIENIRKYKYSNKNLFIKFLDYNNIHYTKINGGKVRISEIGKKNLLNLVYKDLITLSNINDSIYGLLRRNKYIDVTKKYSFLKNEIKEFKRDLQIS